MRWDEDNCALDECEFVREAVRQKAWAFVSDYYRMRALRNFGGLYLDVDTVVRRDPAPLFEDASFVCGYIVDCCVHTHVLASEPGHEIPTWMVDLYERTEFVDEPLPAPKQLAFEGDRVLSCGLTTNNYYLTRLMLDHYPSFRLDGRTDEFAPGCWIYDKRLFTTGSLLNREYFFDLSWGSWRGAKGPDSLAKRVLAKTPLYDYAQKAARIARSRDIQNHVFYQDYFSKREGR